MFMDGVRSVSRCGKHVFLRGLCQILNLYHLLRQSVASSPASALASQFYSKNLHRMINKSSSTEIAYTVLFLGLCAPEVLLPTIAMP